MDENNLENSGASETKELKVIAVDPKQIAGAIIIAGIIIAGAILLKGNMPAQTAGLSGETGRKLNPSTAKVVGLNLEEFKKCLGSGEFAEKVQADVESGTRAGVTGTPSSFILKDGKVIDTIAGAQPLEVVTAKIAQARTGAVTISKTIDPVSSDEHIWGDANASIVIVEYSDLECPFCKAFHTTLLEVVKNNPDVAWVYRHYPIPQLHPKAFHEAEATECAWAQGGNVAFWKYTNKIFEITPSNNRLEESEL